MCALSKGLSNGQINYLADDPNRWKSSMLILFKTE